MLEKKDITYYRRLGVSKLIIAASLFTCSFIMGVSARFENSEIHAYTPYWVGLPLLFQSLSILLASRLGKRWPLGIWLVFFILSLAAKGAYLSITPAFKSNLFDRYPCYHQRNIFRQAERCVCASGSYSNDVFLKVNNAGSEKPCYRALNIVAMFTNVSYLLIALSLIPVMLTFVLVCNDLCCVSCRRAASIPQVLVTQPAVPGGPQSIVPIQSQMVTYRTDEVPGASSGQASGDQAGPLPTKQGAPPPAHVPHSY